MALGYRTCLLLFLACVCCSEAYTCTAAGRFAASSCRQYYLCVANSTTGGYTAYLYTCPGSSKFNSATSLCSTGTVTCATTTTSATTASTSTTTTSSYTCTASGRYAYSGNCRQYYLCVATSTGYTAYLYTCPGTSRFNSATGLCTTASVSCTSSTTSTSTSTTSTSTTTAATTTAACTSSGFTCASNSTFYVCVDSTPSGDVQSCAAGLYCSNSCDLECSSSVSC